MKTMAACQMFSLSFHVAKLAYLFINIPHHSHLLLAFSHILLIDAKSINPIVFQGRKKTGAP
jgi:hypothetical protein